MLRASNSQFKEFPLEFKRSKIETAPEIDLNVVLNVALKFKLTY